MVKHNNMLTNPHFRKDWDKKMLRTKVVTWFDQPAQKQRRRRVRQEKAKRIYPRPVSGDLRPVVRGQTNKYNRRVRLGRGFSRDELHKAGITPQTARTIGISVDHRRKNRSVETLQANVQRLKLYKSKLVVFPRKAGKPKPGDADAKDLASVVQQSGTLPVKVVNPKDKARVITAKEKTDSAFVTLRKAVAQENRVGEPIRIAKLVEAGEEPANAKKIVRGGRAAPKKKQ